ncbi:MAG: hypothetical protein VKO65_03685 [Cyanobacteriota bacterium]|nr:hypothetical protein [Cyanobacteriota bacterium]
MSTLREIMQRLRARHAGAGDPPVLAGALIESHLADYQARLEACTPAMLQYEWAWIEQHLETLELASTTPSMLEAAGGASQIAALLQETRRFRDLLEQRFRALGLRPATHRHTVLDTAHAWELNQQELRDLWGF